MSANLVFPSMILIQCNRRFYSALDFISMTPSGPISINLERLSPSFYGTVGNSKMHFFAAKSPGYFFIHLFSSRSHGYSDSFITLIQCRRKIFHESLLCGRLSNLSAKNWYIQPINSIVVQWCSLIFFCALGVSVFPVLKYSNNLVTSSLTHSKYYLSTALN